MGVPAYGERADWHRNILAHPPVEVRTGGSRFAPRYRLLGPDERFAALPLYQWRYRRAFRASMRFLGHPYDGIEAGLRALAGAAAMVAFGPQQAARTDQPQTSTK